MYERVVAFLTSVQEFFVANSQLKNSNLLNNSMIPDPFVSHAKVSLAKSSNKGCGQKWLQGKVSSDRPLETMALRQH